MIENYKSYYSDDLNSQYCKLSRDFPLIHKGSFYGDIDNANIAIGCYTIGTGIDFVHNSFPNDFSPWYGLFIQFESFNTQLIISGGSAQIGFRRRAGNPPVWDKWRILQ